MDAGTEPEFDKDNPWYTHVSNHNGPWMKGCSVFFWIFAVIPLFILVLGWIVLRLGIVIDLVIDNVEGLAVITAGTLVLGLILITAGTITFGLSLGFIVYSAIISSDE